MNVLILFLLTTSWSVIASSSIQLVNQQVNTYIDVSSQIVFVSRKVLVENVANVPVKTYTLAVDPSWSNNLSFIEAVDSQGTYLQVVKDYSKRPELRYEIFFDDALYPATQQTLNILTVFIDVVQNQPKKIKQYETHSVSFTFNVYYYSLYFTTAQTTVLYVGANKVSYVDGAEFKVANDSDSKYGLQYGSYHNQNPEKQYLSSVNYENTSPFLVVEQLQRCIRTSHWGFVTVTDRISLVHAGPKLEGPYERPFKSAKPDVTRIDYFVSTLPRHAFDIYLKDEIGMISSFSVDDSDETKVDVEIKPRFVLYGGWKTYYELSYSLPVEYYLVLDDNTFTLTLPLIDKVFPNLVVKAAEISLVLPEGASFVDLDPYTELENTTDTRYCHMFDTMCRQVVTFRKRNLFHHHSKAEVRFTYSFSQYLLLTKPLVLAASMYVMLLLVLVLSRLSTSSAGPANPEPHLRLTKSERVITKTAVKYVKERQKKHVCRRW